MALSTPSLRILRQRLWYTHPDPSLRTVVNEYTLVNETDSEVKDVILVDLPLMVGLEVFSESEGRLPFLPNEEVRKIIEPLIEQEKKKMTETEEQIKAQSVAIQKLEQMVKHGPPYYLWIKLPDNEKICPGDSKIIRLKYREVTEPGVPKLSVTIFNKERHRVVFRKPPNQPYDIFVNIVGPSGYELDSNSIAIFDDLTILDKTHGFYHTHLDDFEQVRIPHTDKQAINCLILYDIAPPKSEETFFKISTRFMYALSSFLILLGIMAALPPQSYDAMNIAFDTSLLGPMHLPDVRTAFGGIIDKLFEISLGIVALAVAIIGFVKDPLFNRARFVYLGAAALAMVAFVIRQYGFIPGN